MTVLGRTLSASGGAAKKIGATDKTLVNSGHKDDGIGDGWTTPTTIPGKFGARASNLYAILAAGHYDLKLPPDERHRIALWLDSNADFFGAYENTDAQARGEIVRPSVE